MLLEYGVRKRVALVNNRFPEEKPLSSKDARESFFWTEDARSIVFVECTVLPQKKDIEDFNRVLSQIPFFDGLYHFFSDIPGIRSHVFLPFCLLLRIFPATVSLFLLFSHTGQDFGEPL